VAKQSTLQWIEFGVWCYLPHDTCAFSALTLLVGHQEGHPTY